MNRNDWVRGLCSVGTIPLGPYDPIIGVPINVLVGVVWIEAVASTSPNSPLDDSVSYTTVTEGWYKTVEHLRDRIHVALWNELMHPVRADDTITFIHASMWPGKPTENLLDTVREYWPRYADAYVSGTGSREHPPVPTLEPRDEHSEPWGRHDS